MNEFTTPNGDAPLHEPILRNAVTERSMEATRKRALEEGWTLEEVERCYGAFDESSSNSAD
jgi:hypothetical protein